MTEYQTHTALVQSLEAEVSRLKAVNAGLAEAARQALEALAGMLAIVDDSQAVAGYHLNGELEPWEGFPEVEEVRAAITALREALEAAPQPTAVAQEPVAFLHPKYGHMQRNTEHIAAAGIDYVGAGWLPLYAAPQPARQPLTDTEIQTIWCSARNEGNQHGPFWFARAIERAHGIGGKA